LWTETVRLLRQGSEAAQQKAPTVRHNSNNKMQRLYHYTSINNLALILKSESIRFGRLDKVNDPTEGLSSDFHSLSPYIFISCWTANEEENLALWNMYTPNMRGVRIELELPMFKSKNLRDIENLLFDETEYINEDKGYFMLDGVNEPYKIEYTDDIKLLRPAIIRDIGLHVESLAKYKRTIWTFEQEYRYKINLVPIDKNVENEYFPGRYESLIEKQVPPPIDGYLVKISNDVFKKMKIVISPKVLSGDKEIIESLLKNYNETAVIEDSKLTGLIR
jgi:hypothetical protein